MFTCRKKITEKYRSFRESKVFRFALLGAVSFAANLGLTYYFVDVLRLRPEMGFPASLASVLLLNFAANRWFVFEATEQSLGGQFLTFLVSSLLFRICEYGLFLLVFSLIGFGYLPIVATILVTSFCLKFIIFKTHIFAKPC